MAKYILRGTVLLQRFQLLLEQGRRFSSLAHFARNEVNLSLIHQDYKKCIGICYPTRHSQKGPFYSGYLSSKNVAQLSTYQYVLPRDSSSLSVRLFCQKQRSFSSSHSHFYTLKQSDKDPYDALYTRDEPGLSQDSKSKKENIKTIPNLLTTLRLASAPVLAYLVVNGSFEYAFSIFLLAGLTDMLDGYIARNFKNQKSAFGTALDPFADKFLMSFLTISLTVSDLIPLPVTVLILSRDAGLLLASFYFRYISLSPPRTLARYFDFAHVTAKIYPSMISKVNTGFQLSYVACTLAAPVFDFVGSPWLQALMYTTAATTFLSGADYVITWRKRLKFIKN